MRTFLKKNDKYLFYVKEKQIFVEKNKPLFVYNKKHADSLIKNVVITQNKDQYSLINLTFFSCALDENDVKVLYDIGRLDEGCDTVSMSKTRVGVGIGDGQAPTTGLDVRSGLRIPTQLTESGFHSFPP